MWQSFTAIGRGSSISRLKKKRKNMMVTRMTAYYVGTRGWRLRAFSAVRTEGRKVAISQRTVSNSTVPHSGHRPPRHGQQTERDRETEKERTEMQLNRQPSRSGPPLNQPCCCVALLPALPRHGAPNLVRYLGISRAQSQRIQCTFNRKTNNIHPIH